MPDPLLDDAEHGGVSSEDLEAFFNSHPGLRPLNPLNGADPNLPVQFQSGSGRMVPPAGGVEANDPTATPAATPPASTTPVDDNGGEGDGATPPAPSPEPSAPTPDTPLPDPDAPDPNAPPTPPATPSAPPIPPADYVEFEGQQIPASQLRALLDWQQNFANDPDLQAIVTGHLVGRSAPVEGGAPTTPVAGVGTPATPAAGQLVPPDDLDLDDPAIAAIWNIVKTQHDQIQQLSSGVQSTYEAHMATTRQNSQAVYRQAAEHFRDSHELDDNDINILGQVAGRLGVLPSLMQGIDPLTGVAVRPDPLAAVERALEIAYFTVPEYRGREFQRSVKQQQADATRKKNLAAVAGSAGSTARTQTPPRPGTPEARQAMVAEVGQMMTGEWTGDSNN